MKLILALSFFLVSFCAFSYEKEFVITEILSDDVVKVHRLASDVLVEPGDLLLVYSHESKNILGYARAEVMNIGPDQFTATIITHSQ